MAVEFAFMAPVLMLFVFGTVGFGIELAIASGLQQLAAEAARASVGGLSDSERANIVQSFVASHVAAYPFLDVRQLSVTTAPLTAPVAAYQVSLSYDLSSQVVGQFNRLIPALPTRLLRSAVVMTSNGL